MINRARTFDPIWASLLDPGTKIWYYAGMAAKNTSVALGDPFIQFARRKVESGEFATTSEVVREAMRRYMADDVKLEALRAAIQEGIDSGPAEPFDFDEFISEMKSRRRNRNAA